MSTTLRRNTEDVRTLLVALGFWLPSFCIVILTWWSIVDIPVLHYIFVLPDAWYEQDGLAVRTLVIGAYGFVISAIIATGARLLWNHLVFWHNVTRLEFVASPRACLQCLRPMLRFSVVIYVCWSVALSLLVVLLRANLDVLSGLVLTGLALLGIMNLLVPLLLVRRALLRVQSATIEELTRLIVERANEKSRNLALLSELHQLETQLEWHQAFVPFRAGWQYVASIAGSLAIPLLVGLVQQYVVSSLART